MRVCVRVCVCVCVWVKALVVFMALMAKLQQGSLLSCGGQEVKTYRPECVVKFVVKFFTCDEKSQHFHPHVHATTRLHKSAQHQQVAKALLSHSDDGETARGAKGHTAQQFQFDVGTKTR